MRVFFSICLFFCLLGLTAVPVSFDRPLKPGSAFQAELSLKTSREYYFSITGTEQTTVRNETLSLVFFGTIRVLNVNAAGEPLLLELTPFASSGFINGKSLDIGLLNGKTFFADLSKSPCVFYPADKPAAFPKELKIYFSALFHTPPQGGLSAIFGKQQDLKIGTKWNISVDPLLLILKKRGIRLNGERITANAVCKSMPNFQGIPCWEIRANVETKSGTEPDFRLNARLFFPKDSKNGGCVNGSRSSIEIVNKNLPDTEPLSAGSQVKIITRETFVFTLLPTRSSSRQSSPADMILH